VERTLVHGNREMILILAKALDFGWETAMALLFLGAKDHRIAAGDLDDMREEFARLDAETSRGILKVYQSRKNAMADGQGQHRLAQLHSRGWWFR
jgi:hypothetical protein